MEFTKQSIALKRQAINARIKAAQQELAELDQFEALADKLFPNTAITPGAASLSFNVSTVSAAVPMTMTKKDRIVTAVEQILADGKRRTSKELIGELTVLGVDVGGKDPVNNLGAYLSPCTKFNAIRKKGGWGLAPQKKASPNDAPTSKGLISNGSEQSHQVAG